MKGRGKNIDWSSISKEIVEKYKAGTSSTEIAKEHNVNVKSLCRYLRHLGIIRSPREALQLYFRLKQEKLSQPNVIPSLEPKQVV